MPLIGLEPAFKDPDFIPDPVDVAIVQAALGVGPDTAAIVTRRQGAELLAASFRTGGGDVDLCDILDALIAAIFDA